MKKLFLVLVVFAGLFVSGCLDSDEVVFKLSVWDDAGTPLDAARVSLVPENSNLSSNVFTTDAKGLAFGVVSADFYTITVSKEGFFSAVLEKQDLRQDYSGKAELEKLR